MPRYTPRLAYVSMTAICALLAACSSPSSTEVRQQAGQLNTQSREHIAAAAEASGDSDLALSMYAKASAEAPGNSEIRLHYADMLVRTGKIGPARDLLTRGLASGSDSIDVRRGLGILDVMSGLHDEAIAELDKVLVVQPKDVSALVNKAVALDLAGKHAEAQQAYLKAQEASPDDPAIINDLALSLALQGRIREARALLNPFTDIAGIPERMRMTMKILDRAIAPTDPSAGALAGDSDNKEIDRLALALAHAERGGSGDAIGSRIQGR